MYYIYFIWITGKLGTSMSRLLMSVVTLRENNWGRAPSAPSSPRASTPGNNYSQEPVFFNLAGRPITREEAGYGMSRVPGVARCARL